MIYRNVPRLVLGVLALILGFATLVTMFAFASSHSDWNGQPGLVNSLTPVLLAVFFVAFAVTGTGWLVLRGINYDTWFRATHPGEPLLRDSSDSYSGPSDWKAAERDPHS